MCLEVSEGKDGHSINGDKRTPDGTKSLSEKSKITNCRRNFGMFVMACKVRGKNLLNAKQKAQIMKKVLIHSEH